MYRKLFMILLTLIITMVAIAQKHECARFKTGTFKLLDTPSENYLIVRNDTIQWESAKNSIIQSEFYIRWTDNCRYELTLKKIHNRPAGLKMPDDKMVLFVNIYKVSGDTCWVETGSNLSSFTKKNRMLKIKNSYNE